MKILLVGDWSSELHEAPAAKALESLGHQVEPFAWGSVLTMANSQFGRLLGRVQNKMLMGPGITALNSALVERAASFVPDVVFIYRGTHVRAATLRKLRDLLPAAAMVGLVNDDPFSPTQPRMLWRHLIESLPHYDLLLAYRHHNIEEFRRAGAREVRLLRSWYVPERNHPVELSERDVADYGCDVVFVGHYEADGRLQCLEEAARRGLSVRVYGPGKGFTGFDWDTPLRRSATLRRLAPVRLVWGEEYNKVLCAAKIALCFLSKHNRDTYTRRCFEIPAAGTMLLSEYSDDIAGLFSAGQEADFFRTPIELGDKLARYVSDDALRSRIARAGRDRVLRDGHDVRSRMGQVIEWVEETK